MLIDILMLLPGSCSDRCAHSACFQTHTSSMPKCPISRLCVWLVVCSLLSDYEMLLCAQGHFFPIKRAVFCPAESTLIRHTNEDTREKVASFKPFKPFDVNIFIYYHKYYSQIHIDKMVSRYAMCHWNRFLLTLLCQINMKYFHHEKNIYVTILNKAKQTTSFLGHFPKNLGLCFYVFPFPYTYSELPVYHVNGTQRFVGNNK